MKRDEQTGRMTGGVDEDRKRTSSLCVTHDKARRVIGWDADKSSLTSKNIEMKAMEERPAGWKWEGGQHVESAGRGRSNAGRKM